MVVLKGPEASALYGIDAANGAIVITTKRGKAGTGGFEYSNRFRVDQTRAQPDAAADVRPDQHHRRRARLVLVLRRAVRRRHAVLRQHRRLLPDRR